MSTLNVTRQKSVFLLILTLFLKQPLHARIEDTTFKAEWFLFVNEFVGSDPRVMVRDHMQKRMGNGFQINRCGDSNPLMKYANVTKSAFFYYLPASTRMLERLGGFPSANTAYIQEEVADLKKLTTTLGYHKVWWNLMPEFDQVGGPWEAGRTIDNSTRESAYLSWKNYYSSNNVLPLGTYLQQSRTERGVSIAAVSAFSFSTHYSFELGADMCILERNNDDIGDIQTGISFVRGAARQYDRPWGIDISNWRRATKSPTEFDDRMQQVGGWSPSYMRRHLYISYMSGAHVILNEALANSSKTHMHPNPIAKLIKEVADFVLSRDKGIPKPIILTALMLDFHHGFEPKFGSYMQGNYVWYSRIPYNEGDFMTHNFFEMAFPEYSKSGTLPRFAPQTPSAYRKAIRDGADPRPWEPMGKSRWGDHFDVILSNATPNALRNYKTILLLGDVKLSEGLKKKLESWVHDGGVLIVNVCQVSHADETFLGVQLTENQKRASTSQWLAEPNMLPEKTYKYIIVNPVTAVRLAENEKGDPVVTMNRIGKGQVILTTPRYLQNEAKSSLLQVGQKLISEVVQRHAAAQVTGPFLVEYIVGRDANKTVVTIANNTGTNWNGTVGIQKPETRFVAREWLRGNSVNYSIVSDSVVMPAFVPAYDVRIFALEYFNHATSRSQQIK